MDSPEYIVAILGDLHVNSTVALCLPRFTLDDGGQYVSSKYQRWIWRKFKEYCLEIEEVKAALKVPVVTVLNGELVDDNHHKTTQLVTRNPADMLRLSAATLEPILALSDYVHVTRGTEAHSGPSACLDEVVAADISNLVPSLVDREGQPERYSHWHFTAKIGGVLFDIAHHPGTGHRLPWTKGTDAIKLANVIGIQALNLGRPVPDLAIRGHNHKDADSFDNARVRAIIMPSWQMTTSFGYRIGGDPLKIGALYVIVGQGQYEVVKRYWDWPLERPWSPEQMEAQYA